MEGRMNVLRLIRFFNKKGEGLLFDSMVEDYSIAFDEAMDISDLISQLSSLKSDHEDLFEEFPLSDLINLHNKQQLQSHLLQPIFQLRPIDILHSPILNLKTSNGSAEY